ncbi:AAA-domain-containing protein [Cylindrobasidium torrendii FP15055 ss-10]|uniref:AAA-domain-containing protein n=1 Tax=Cylindrobasidium torrendii FP15055 ss-10 TaxID=1314674 RepID=A0A0D7B223_9AGAR|nr:AAA-domain-containing protein [Cylindrobasidium torrendii FP15055 ss-10]
MQSPATTKSLLRAARTVRVRLRRDVGALECARLPGRLADARFVSTSPEEQDSTPDGPLNNNTSPEASAPPPPPPLSTVTPLADRPERGRRTKTSIPPIEPVDWPADLDVLWTPAENAQVAAEDLPSLPPPEIFDEALNNLLITLHPQTQNRAVYPTPTSPVVEPTLALYCPIEGGDYVIDATVRELARRTGAEVLVLDAVQLAAGEHGEFGKSAEMLRFNRNPLHFRATSVMPAQPPPEEDEDFMDERDMPMGGMPMHGGSMMLTVLSPSSSRNPAVMSASKLSSTPPNKAKIFFDALVNMPASEPSKGTATPRIIYIRDYPTLAPSSSTWYHHLLHAVRQRRRGPIASPSSPVTHPMTIVFGVCPPITPPEIIAPPPHPLSLLTRGRSAPITSAATRTGRSDWNEDEVANVAREARLRRRLKRWEKGDASLLEEIPPLGIPEDGEDAGNGHRQSAPEMATINGRTIPLPFPAMFPGSNARPAESDNKTSFFRTSVLVPNLRSQSVERNCRIERRREINELTSRMAVGSVGGVLDTARAGDLVTQAENAAAEALESADADATTIESSKTPHEQMWDQWGQKVELWMNVRHVADRAVGSVVAERISLPPKRPSLESTPVSWDAVAKAWVSRDSVKDLRKSWLKEAIASDKGEPEGEQKEKEEEPSIDELVERLKNDPDLDAHEQKLLPSIVNPLTMPTSFSQVHLPTNTVDSVRTIVSLPLLHPEAFQQGILKEHNITGCLLFGPPGTGKTLVIRALAKEAGCRMMNIAPSDVMDMYVGEGEKIVKAVFTLARKLSPCVVFLDEIDALLGARSSARDSGSSIAHRGVITEFMQEMDGLKTSRDSTVIVIGATNRPFDLDDAVLRRLPRRVLVDLPGEKERAEILKIMLRNETLADDVDLAALAKRTESFSGSDLKHLCVSAAMDAVKEQVDLPWATTSKRPADAAAPMQDEDIQVSEDSSADEIPDAAPSPTAQPRILGLRHFEKSFKEITPSSSEATGTLSALRKWNEEFGEGAGNKKRKQIWGKGRFGFTNPAKMEEEDGRVRSTTTNERA